MYRTGTAGSRARSCTRTVCSTGSGTVRTYGTLARASIARMALVRVSTTFLVKRTVLI